jgi:hypothetical protein
LNKATCACAFDWRRIYVAASLVVITILSVANAIAASSASPSPMVTFATFLFVLAYVIVTRQYVTGIESSECKCAEKPAFKMLKVVKEVNDECTPIAESILADPNISSRQGVVSLLKARQEAFCKRLKIPSTKNAVVKLPMHHNAEQRARLRPCRQPAGRWPAQPRTSRTCRRGTCRRIAVEPGAGPKLLRDARICPQWVLALELCEC